MISKVTFKMILTSYIVILMVGCTNTLPTLNLKTELATKQEKHSNSLTKRKALNFKGVAPLIQKLILKRVKENKVNAQNTYRNALISLYEPQKKQHTFSTQAISSSSAETIVNQLISENQKRPDMSIDEQGNGLIVWEDSRNGEEDIWARKVSNYTLSGNEFIVNQNTSNSQKEARISLNSQGHGLIVWEDNRNGVRDIWARKVSDYTLSGNEFIVNQTTYGSRYNPEVTIDDNGNGLIVWEQEYKVHNYGINFYITYTRDVQARRITNYLPENNELIVHQFTSDEQTNPSISLNNNGDGLVVWEDNRLGDADIWARKVSNYSMIDDAFIVNQTTTDKQTNPNISLNDNGSGLVVWTDKRSGTEDVWARKVSNLSMSGEEFIIHQTTTDKQTSPNISLNNSGNGMVVWTDKRSGTEDVWARKVSNLSMSGEEFIIHQTTTDKQYEPSVISNQSGHSIVVWADKRNGDDDIYTTYIQNTEIEQEESCPDNSVDRPTSPTIILEEDFSTATSDFGNQGDGSSEWTQWGGDYYPSGKGVVLWNPGPGQGVRDVPGEFINERPGLLETGIFRKVNLSYSTGDKLIAKMNIATTFSDSDSDATVLLYFNNPDGTIAISHSLNKTTSQEVMIEALIPPCSTQVTVIALGYLGFNETSSLTFEKMTLEQIPDSFYSQSTLVDDPLDASENNSFGSNSPANMDSEFNYDMYTVDNYPIKYSGDKAVTVAKQGSGAPAGGMVKQVTLESFKSGDVLTAFLYTATTFTDPSSEAYLKLEFYNANGQLLGNTISSKINGYHYRWLSIDRAAIPSDSSYVKLVPTVTLGASETSSLLWDDLKLYLLQP